MKFLATIRKITKPLWMWYNLIYIPNRALMAIPTNANEFIEQELNRHINKLRVELNADILSFNGPLIFGIDDLVRNVVEGIRKKSNLHDKLVVILTSPGGYIEVVQRIVDTIRHHYEIIDFVVPNYAYSAGTVLAMSGDAIHMNYYSRLGPIDPQLETDKGMVPALGYLIQWERLIKKAQNNELTTAEANLMVYGFNQGELYRFEQERELSVDLLIKWLATYKFKNWEKTETQKLPVTPEMRENRAEEIARLLNDTEKWDIHGYGISIDILRKDIGLLIDDFDEEPKRGTKIKNYYDLLADYMQKRGNSGVIHVAGQYLPFN